jgi:hypothetical protein
VDIGSYPGLDLSRMVALHNDPDTQDMHCLRAAWQDGEEGDAEAVGSCRQAVRREVGLALDASSPDELEPVRVNLCYQGAREVMLSRFYYHLGRAVHVVQDSFSHCYRTEDRLSIVEVANWVEDVSGRLDPSRDGPAHDDDADDCQCTRPLGQPTYDAVLAASTDLIRLASMDAPRPDVEAQLETFLDLWMSHVEGCTRENGYCESPDPAELASDPCQGCQCTLVRGRASQGGLVALALLAAALLVRRWAC